MVIRQRAIQAEDKEERHHAILDAAERLLLRSRDRAANVAEVADEAGLAKGTVYLYFAGKEQLLLALHERNVDAFFRALVGLCDRGERVRVEDILALMHAHMIDPPLFLTLATRCFAQMDQGVEPLAAAAFRQRMAERLLRAGAGLERHFRLEPGSGVVLLRHSYALILGLWQMANASGSEGPRCPAGGTTAPGSPFAFSYPDDVDRALRALWRGSVGARHVAGAR